MFARKILRRGIQRAALRRKTEMSENKQLNEPIGRHF